MSKRRSGKRVFDSERRKSREVTVVCAENCSVFDRKSSEFSIHDKCSTAARLSDNPVQDVPMPWSWR